MAVKDVFEPKPVELTDPVAGGKEPSDSAYWADKARSERAKREYEEEKAMREAANSREPEAIKPGFEVKGSLNMGDIDLQKQAEERERKAEEERKRSSDEVKEERRLREKSESEKHQMELEASENRQRDMVNRFDKLEAAVTAGKVSQKSFAQQIAEITELATALGYAKPDPGLPSGENIRDRMELVKLQNENSRAEREFKRQMRNEEREYQRQLRKDEDDHNFRSAELEQKRKRDETLYKAPEMIGRAIAAGVAESAGGGGVGNKSKPFNAEAAPGESGTLDCPNPNCGAKIGIAPTTKTAICAKCGTKIKVTRTGEGPEMEAGDESRRES